MSFAKGKRFIENYNQYIIVYIFSNLLKYLYVLIETQPIKYYLPKKFTYIMLRKFNDIIFKPEKILNGQKILRISQLYLNDFFNTKNVRNLHMGKHMTLCGK